MKSVLLPHPANIGLASCNTNLCPTLSTVQAKANKLNPKLCQPNHVIINCLARHISVEIVCRTEGSYVFSRFIYNICWVHRSARQPGNYFACKCEKSSPAPPPHRWPRLVLYFVSTQCPPLWEPSAVSVAGAVASRKHTETMLWNPKSAAMVHLFHSDIDTKVWWPLSSIQGY